MENTFENALAYIGQLKELFPDAQLDDKVLARAFVAYSTKTNKPTRALLQSFAERFREWQREWDSFGNGRVHKQPKSVDEFIEELLHTLSPNH